MKTEPKTSVDQTAGDYRVRIWKDGRTFPRDACVALIMATRAQKGQP